MSLADLFVPTVSPPEVVFRAAFVYALMLVLFRVFGRAQNARHAGFDVVVLFLVGTALRKTIVADDESLTSGAIAICTLFALDWAMSFVTWRNETLSFVVEGRPRLIVKDGRPVEDALRRSRINPHELREKLRAKGTEDVARVRAAYVERDGRITVLLRD
jgi:uncharacterized membrane protein YcaP (DUF421 family)